MNSTRHGEKNFDKKYYSRFFKKDGELDFFTYKNWFWGWYNFVKKYVPLEKNSGARVLEVGTAIGAFASVLQERGFDVTASDVSKFILQKASDNNPKVKFRFINLDHPIKTGEFYDFVFAFEVLEHLKDPKTGMKHIKDSIKDGGYFIFSTPPISNQTLKDPTHINVHDSDWWLKLGNDLGFKETRFKNASFLPFCYRWSKTLSIGIPYKIPLAIANNTCFYFFKK